MTPRVRQVVIGAATAVAAGLVVAAVVVAGSGDDGAAPASTTTEAPTTTAAPTASSAIGTLPPTVATTARPTPTSTLAVATTPAGTTTRPPAATSTSAAARPSTAAPVVSGGTSTTDPDAAPAFPCEAPGLLAAFRAAQPLPAGARLDEVRCYGAYAGGVISSDGTNRAFAVFGASPTAWRLLNVGSAFVCQPLEIPDPVYTTIGCPAWDL